tara:strand:- start:139 stop:255 length:117 start_codon:yes stop_codon:yes gene_type:complete
MKNFKTLLSLYKAMTKQGKVITWFALILIAIFTLDWLF